jgi:hypothetical protein
MEELGSEEQEKEKENEKGREKIAASVPRYPDHREVKDELFWQLCTDFRRLFYQDQPVLFRIHQGSEPTYIEVQDFHVLALPYLLLQAI